MIRFISLLVSIPLIIIMSAFAYKNADLVTLDLFLFKADIPLILVLLIALLIGVIIGFLFNLVALLDQKKKYRQLKNKKETLQGLSGVLDQSDK